MRTPRRAGRVLIVTVGALVVVGCSDDAAGPTTTPLPGFPDRPAPTVVADPDPFCDGIVSLEGRARDEAVTAGEILAVYDSIAADAPAAIAADFELVRAALRTSIDGDATTDDPATTDPLVAEATERLSIWVDEVCRGTDRSPLPPPTEPGSATD